MSCKEHRKALFLMCSSKISFKPLLCIRRVIITRACLIQESNSLQVKLVIQTFKQLIPIHPLSKRGNISQRILCRRSNISHSIGSLQRQLVLVILFSQPWQIRKILKDTIRIKKQTMKVWRDSDKALRIKLAKYLLSSFLEVKA